MWERETGGGKEINNHFTIYLKNIPAPNFKTNISRGRIPISHKARDKD